MELHNHDHIVIINKSLKKTLYKELLNAFKIPGKSTRGLKKSKNSILSATTAAAAISMLPALAWEKSKDKTGGNQVVKSSAPASRSGEITAKTQLFDGWN